MAYSVGYPNAEWHEILPNLFLGGHVWREGFRTLDGRHSAISNDPSWDYVVSAYLDLDNKESFPQCDMRLVLFNDTEKALDEETWKKIRLAVDEVVYRWRCKQKILVRCQAGYNRSGLLMSLVLMRLGFSAEKAIRQVRERRSQDVLVNPVFERYVHELEGEYLDSDSLPSTEATMNALVPVMRESDEASCQGSGYRVL